MADNALNVPIGMPGKPFTIDLVDPEWLEWAGRNLVTEDPKTGELVNAIMAAHRTYSMVRGDDVWTASGQHGVISTSNRYIVIVEWDDPMLGFFVYTPDTHPVSGLLDGGGPDFEASLLPFPWEEAND